MGEQLYSQMFHRNVISIQARMGPPTRRLPGKELLPVMGKPLLAYQIERLRRAGVPVVVCTPDTHEDDRIINVALASGARALMGHGDDPPARHLSVARQFNASVLGFCGGDQTFVSAEHFTLAFERMAQGDCDYVRVVGLPHGLHVWAIARWALEECAADKSRDADEIEHTGAYWDRRPERFRTVDLDMGRSSDYRLTVDTPEDFQLHRLLLEELYPRNPLFTVDDLIATLDAHPQWAALNHDVEQYYWQGAANRPQVKA